jgi:Ca2+:H+ antiporter
MQRSVAAPTWQQRLRGELPLVFGLLTLGVFLLLGEGWLAETQHWAVRVIIFLWLLAAIGVCIFGVVRHADHLADLLGEPLGTLILTITVIMIEVALIVSVMLQGVADPTLARDTMFAVIMLMMNGMVGLALLAGGIRHVQQEYNLEGARAYLAVLIPLAAVALVLPNRTMSTEAGTMNFWQAIIFSIATILLYAIFLGLQTMRHRGFFVAPGEEEEPPSQAELGDARTRRRSILFHSALLFLTMVPIVGLAEFLASMIEQGIHTLGIPTALGGVLIAALILAPESISALEAAIANKLQRSINLCLGSALSTVALTVPAVLLIGVASGQEVRLGLSEDNTVLLMLTLLVSMLTFSGARTNVLYGAVHLLLFLTFMVLIFNP